MLNLVALTLNAFAAGVCFFSYYVGGQGHVLALMAMNLVFVVTNAFTIKGKLK